MKNIDKVMEKLQLIFIYLQVFKRKMKISSEIEVLLFLILNLMNTLTRS